MSLHLHPDIEKLRSAVSWRVWRTDEETDAFEIAKTRLALRTFARKSLEKPKMFKKCKRSLIPRLHDRANKARLYCGHNVIIAVLVYI